MTQGVLHYRAEAVMDTRITGSGAIWGRNRHGRRGINGMGHPGLGINRQCHLRCFVTPRDNRSLGSRCRITPGCGQGRGGGVGSIG